MKDVYGRGIWWVFVPTSPCDGHVWMWDEYEQDAVCMKTGAWLKTELGLDSPRYIDVEDRCVVFAEDANSPYDVDEIASMIAAMKMHEEPHDPSQT